MLAFFCCLSRGYAQNLVNPKNVSGAGKCDGSASLSSSAQFITWSWFQDKDSASVLLQEKGLSILNLCAGSYRLEYADTSGKHSFTFGISVNTSNPCQEFSVSVAKIQPNNPTTTNVCNGLVQLAVQGGHAPFIFTWSNNPSKTNVAEKLCAGSYSGYVKDSNNCTAQFSATVKDSSINNPNPCEGFKVFASKVQNNKPTNPNECNGFIELTTQGGHAPFVFTWSNNPSKSNVAEKLCAGNYAGYVKDSNNCIAQFSLFVGNDSTNTGGKPCQVELKGVPADTTGLNFYLTLVPRVENNGTVKTYELKIDGKVVSNDTAYFAKMTKGMHIIEYAITTSIGCDDRHIDTMIFPFFDKPNVDCSKLRLDLVSKINNKQGSTNCIGALEVKAMGGTAPYSFHWNNGQMAPLAKGLCPGKYDVEVKDSNNCRFMASYVVLNDSVIGTNPCKDFKVELSKVINDKAGDTICSGYIDVHAVNGLAPFNFLWKNGPKTSFNEKLCAGVYTVTVKDGNNCYATFSQEVKEESVVNTDPCQGFKVDIAKVTNDVAGDSLCTGRIELRTIAGNAPFIYTWTPGISKSNVLERACAGKYTVYVKDAKNCTATLTVNVGVDSIPTSTANCTGFIANIGGKKNDIAGDTICSGAAYVTIAGGKQPYTYYWANGQKDLYISNLCAGNYEFKAIDANGCIAKTTAEIKQDSLVNVVNCASLVANVLVKNDQVSTTGGCNGALEASVSGGKAPYSFVWNTSSKDRAIKSLCEGKYSVTITDANKCVLTVVKFVGRDSIVQNPCAGFFGNAYVKNDQAGDNVCTGTIVANVGGGKAPYAYKWSNGTTLPYLKGACEGTYSVTVYDQSGCSITLDKYVGVDTVINPCKEFYAKISGFENTGLSSTVCNGSLTTTVVGGKAPYDFTWNNGVKSPSITGLCPGEYIVEVKDANNCALTLTGKVFIDSMKNLCDGFYTKVTSLTNDKAGDNTCTGEIKTETFGGKAPYYYKWTNGAETASIQNVCVGKYALYVKDANNCIFQLDRFVGSDSIVNPCKDFYAYVSNIVDDSEDNATCQGKLAVEVKGGKAPYVYAWSNGDSTAAVMNLCSDGYTVKITDNAGCLITLNAKVRKNPSKKATLNAVVHTADATSASACDGAMKIEILSGNAPYAFYHSNGEVGQYRTNICPGVYTVYVKDAKGEVIQLSYLISAPTNTIKNDKPEFKDSIVKDTVKGSVTKDCSIDYNAIDSVKIKDYKLYKSDSLLVTWAVFTAGRIVYVTDIYVFKKGKGVYSLKLDLYCNEQKELGNFVSATESILFEAETTASISKNEMDYTIVYPNPFTDNLTVNLVNTQDYTLRVLDMSGKTLLNNDYKHTNSIKVDLDHLSSGQYILQVVGETNSVTRMITK